MKKEKRCQLCRRTNNVFTVDTARGKKNVCNKCTHTIRGLLKEFIELPGAWQLGGVAANIAKHISMSKEVCELIARRLTFSENVCRRIAKYIAVPKKIIKEIKLPSKTELKKILTKNLEKVDKLNSEVKHLQNTIDKLHCRVIANTRVIESYIHTKKSFSDDVTVKEIASLLKISLEEMKNG